MSITARHPESEPARPPIAAVRISTVALVGILAAVAVPAGAASLVLNGVTGAFDTKRATLGIQQTDRVSKIVVTDAGGSVRVTGDPTMSGVSGKAEFRWHGSGEAPMRLEQSVADGVLTLRKVCVGDGDCGTASIDIRVPPAVAIQATTSNAGIDVFDVNGGVNLETSNAGITAKGLGSGDAVMRTSNASVSASFSGAPKSIKAYTSNAGIDIVTDGKTPYYDSVKVSNGSPELKNVTDRHTDNEIDAETSNGDVVIK